MNFNRLKTQGSSSPEHQDKQLERLKEVKRKDDEIVIESVKWTKESIWLRLDALPHDADAERQRIIKEIKKLRPDIVMELVNDINFMNSVVLNDSSDVRLGATVGKASLGLG